MLPVHRRVSAPESDGLQPQLLGDTPLSLTHHMLCSRLGELVFEGGQCPQMTSVRV